MAQSKDLALAIFGGSLAGVGLVLFFIGLMANTLENYRHTDAKAAYKWVVGIAYTALILGLCCVGLSSSWLLGRSSPVYTALVWVFVAQLVLLLVAASIVVAKVITIK